MQQYIQHIQNEAKDNTYIEFGKERNNKDPKFKIDDHVRISKYKNIFSKGYTPNLSEEIFIIKKVKNTAPWHLLLVILMVKKLLEQFMKKIVNNKSRRIQNRKSN